MKVNLYSVLSYIMKSSNMRLSQTERAYSLQAVG